MTSAGNFGLEHVSHILSFLLKIKIKIKTEIRIKDNDKVEPLT